MKRALLTLPCVLTMISCMGDGDSSDGNRRYATLELETAYPHAFSYLSGIRERSDGTLLAADPMSQVLLRVNMAAGTADTLGREGPGPDEYKGPDRVFPLPGDSTLLVDLGNGRLTVIDPEDAFVGSTPMTTATEDGMGHTIHPSFVDTAGNMYADGLNYREDPPDSTTLHRIERETGEETRAASVWHALYARRQPGEKRPMLSPHDDWAVGGNGHIAVIRANGYSVDWYYPDGRVVHGPPNQVETFPVGLAEKEAVLEDMATNAIFAMMQFDDDGIQSMQMSRGMPPGSRSGVDDYAWPETLPVFHGEAANVSPAGELWVPRMMPAGAPGRIDVFDEHGIRSGFIEIPPRSKVVGFGRQGEVGSRVYLARTDNVGLIWLEKYRILGTDERR